MKLKDIALMEAPLPDDWNKGIFDPKVPFSQRVKYAVERAQKIGTGSSRIAFEIPYKGKATILKVAKNRKGMAQNYEEAELLSDYVIKQSGMVIPMIDYDEANGGAVTWIHTEKATKMTPATFKRFFGCTASELVGQAHYQISGRGGRPSTAVDPDNEYVMEFMDVVGNYYTMIDINDFSREANWGVYRGNPVIIDLGATHEVITTYYR